MKGIIGPIVCSLVSRLDFLDIFFNGSVTVRSALLEFMNTLNLGETRFALRTRIFAFRPLFNAGKAVWMDTPINLG